MQHKQIVTPLSLFYSYAHEDELFRQRLETHLSQLRRQGLISGWHDRQIAAGTEWKQEIDAHLETASIILLLISPDFLASDYCYDIEMQRALERHQRGEARVAPILLRPCDWQHAPFAHLQALPHDGKAITTWDNQDEAFLEIVQGIRQLIEHRPPRLSSTLDQQNRARLLEKVSIRSQDILEQSLQGVTQIQLRLRTNPAAVLNTVRLRLRQGIRPEQEVPANTTIVQLYEQTGGELLILGAPGAGKTTLLLELACALQARATHEHEHPVPVIVNLSSWSNARCPLEEWLVEEIVRSYDVPRRAIAQLMQQEQVLPLLDGLDELPEQGRSACIEAINMFKQTHWLSLVVCSRSQEYAAQPRRLTLQSAVVVQPLDEHQVDAYFKAAGPPLAGIRSVLRRNAELRELVTTPLMLQVVTLTYWNVSVQALPKKGTTEEQQRQIFDQYVQRRLENQEASGSTQRTLHQLSWLARQMRTHNQTIFYLEHLQPDWLPAGRERHRYERLAVRGSGIIVGVLLSLLVKALFFTIGPLTYDIWFGLIGGLIGGLISGGDTTGFRLKGMMQVCKQRWRSLGLLGAGNGVLVGGFVAAAFALWGIPSHGLIYGSSAGLCGFLLTVVIMSGKVVALRSASSVPSRHWWRRLFPQGLQPSHLLVGVIVGLLFGLSYGLSRGLSDGLSRGLSDGLSFGLSDGLSFGLSVGLSYGLSFGIIGAFLSLLLLERKSDIELAEIVVWSGKRLRQSFTSKHHLSTSTRILLLIFLLFGLSYGLSLGLSLGLSDGVLIGSAGALFAALLMGGLAGARHLLLRLQLQRLGVISRHPVRFLDDAARRILLYKDGGGYRFIHRLFLDYFADLEAEPPVAQPATQASGVAYKQNNGSASSVHG